MLTYWDLTEPNKIIFVSKELMYLKLSAKRTEEEVTGESGLRLTSVNYTHSTKKTERHVAFET